MKEKRKGNYYRLTQDDFLRKIRENQKIPLDLSGVTYKTQKDKYTVSCTKHDVVFIQNGQQLISGAIGCHICLKEYKSHSNISNKDSFLRKFLLRFPDSGFDFSESVYITAKTPMTVTCKKLHKFNISPNNLLSGNGCKYCYLESNGFTSENKTEDYFNKFKVIHGDSYDYLKIKEISNCKQKISILCKIHGSFKMTPDNHLQGKGCPLCGKSGYQPQLSGYFYILKVTEDVIKFGITNNIERRLKEIKNKSKFDISILYYFHFKDGYLPNVIETEIYKDTSVKRGVVSKADMFSGYMETTYYSNISKILSIVDKYTKTSF